MVGDGGMGALLDRLVHWLSGQARPLFGPACLAEVTILVHPDGTASVFSTKVETPEQIERVFRAIVQGGLTYATSKGLTVTWDV